MTAAGSTVDPAVPSLDVSFGRVCRSEWTKLRSLRSTWWLSALTVLLIVGIGLFGTVQTARRADGDRYYRHPGPLDLARDSQTGILVAVLAVLVLAALTVTGEYGTGMIRSSLTAVPRRTDVLLAKAVVVTGVVGVVSAVAALLAFAGAGMVWSSHGRAGASLSDPGVAAVVLGDPLYLSLAAVFAVALATLVRHTAAALGIVVAVFFVVPVLLASWSGASYLPSNAGATLSRLGFGHSLSGGTATGLFAGYSIALLALAVARLRSSDV